MMTLIGNKSRFAAEIGGFSAGSTQLRRVDLWAADQWWTCDDNNVFLPQFCFDVQRTINRLKSGCDLSLPFPGLPPVETHRRLLALDDGSGEQFCFPHWGPTTDNILAHLFRDGERIFIPFEFWRKEHRLPKQLGMVFVAELIEAEFLSVLRQIIDTLGEARVT